MITVYGIKNCDSVKKALRFFKNNQIEYEFVDFKATPVGCDTISTWLTHVEMTTLLNTRGTTYRTLKMKELDLDENAKKEYLCEHNLLIKRPVIHYQNRLIVGFNLSQYEGVFL